MNGSGFDNFYTGHYFSDQKSARMDFYQRIARQWEYYEPAKRKTKSKGPHQPPGR